MSLLCESSKSPSGELSHEYLAPSDPATSEANTTTLDTRRWRQGVLEDGVYSQFLPSEKKFFRFLVFRL